MMFSTTCDSACHLNCVKMAAFQFYLQSGKQRNAKWMGVHSHVVFGQKFPSKKGIVRWVRCRDATASSSVTKVRGEVFAHFHMVTVICHSSMQNWLLACQDNSLWTITLMSKKIINIRFWWGWTFCVQFMLSSLNACLIITRIYVTFFPRFALNLMLFLCWIHCEATSRQLHDSK
jgi:hypothetical protein